MQEVYRRKQNNIENLIGVWVCFKCHMLVEIIDHAGLENLQTRIQSYLNFRKELGVGC